MGTVVRRGARVPARALRPGGPTNFAITTRYQRARESVRADDLFRRALCVLGVYVSGRTREKQTAMTGDAPSIAGTVFKSVERKR